MTIINTMFQGHTIISLILTYRYFILFPLACFEGPILALVVGFLIHLGYFDIVPAFLLMCAGDFFPDSFYYYIGHFGSQKKFLEKYGSRFKLITDHFPVIEKLWHEHTFKTMFFSKIAYGLSTPLLISAGLAKVPFKKFISHAFFITFIEYGLIMSLGYYLGYSYVYAAKYINLVGYIIALAFIVLIAIYIMIQKYTRRQIEKLEKQEESEEQKTL